MSFSFSPDSKTLKVRDQTLDLSSPKIMGILNVTPDSFSDGGEFNTLESALGHIGLMISEGAHIIDVGGESTRPGSDPISTQQEIDRVMPVLEKAIPKFPSTLFSIDTTTYQVAKEALKHETHFVNDISGLQKEPRFLQLCVQHQAAYIMMHSQGNPKVMQENPTYDDVIEDILDFFKEKLELAEKRSFDRIILDPGIGFGKTLDHNLTIIAHLQQFKKLGCPLMIGASRKSMFSKLLGERPAKQRVAATVAAHYHALMQGANILRVHDVREAHDSLMVYNALKSH